ncbi:MAG TPA: glycosyl hydrolase family 65 protein [Chloroflexota bacterium]|nr:glycosyl hydrolase family 65 protein [Chloroflexota bacterium]
MSRSEQRRNLDLAALIPPDGAISSKGDVWRLEHHGFVPELEHDMESRFALSNGYLGMRASLPSPTHASRPRTFVSNLFWIPPGQPRVPCLIPVPDWHEVHVSVDGTSVRLDRGATIDLRRVLDMQIGAYWVEWRYHTLDGHDVRTRISHFLSLADRTLAVQLMEVEGGFPCRLGIEAGAGAPGPGLVPDLRHSVGDVTVWRADEDGSYLAIARDYRLARNGQQLAPVVLPGHDRRRWSFSEDVNGQVAMRRLVSMGRGDREDAVDVAAESLRRARRSGAAALFRAHSRAWSARWSASDVEITGDADAQRAIRFAIYHLVSAADPSDEHVSIGARALTGDAYMGHVFWDTETFLLPFYIHTWPEAARALLMYRYHTLPAARAKAAKHGFRGAFYPWESARNGEEATPPYVITPDGKVIRIVNGEQEIHISADVAFAVWQYWQSTGDDGFFQDAGAEILLETARFWASRATLEADNRWHIRRVVGPDEYHEAIDDNAYTNGMARWNLERGVEIARTLGARWPHWWSGLRRKISISDREVETWSSVASNMTLDFDPNGTIIEQFAGFFQLKPIFPRDYPNRREPMDVLLGRELTQRAQVHKQADAVMLLCLLGDWFSAEVQRDTFYFYEVRCGHGSSLSPAIHALMAARLGDLDLADRYFTEAANIDLEDTFGNAAHGVHIGALGGLWQAIVFGFAGVRFRADGLSIDPHVPAHWGTLAFPVQWRGRHLRVSLEPASGTLRVDLLRGRSVAVTVGGKPYRARLRHPAVVQYAEAK